MKVTFHWETHLYQVYRSKGESHGVVSWPERRPTCWYVETVSKSSYLYFFLVKKPSVSFVWAELLNFVWNVQKSTGPFELQAKVLLCSSLIKVTRSSELLLLSWILLIVEADSYCMSIPGFYPFSQAFTQDFLLSPYCSKDSPWLVSPIPCRTSAPSVTVSDSTITSYLQGMVIPSCINTSDSLIIKFHLLNHPAKGHNINELLHPWKALPVCIVWCCTP